MKNYLILLLLLSSLYTNAQRDDEYQPHLDHAKPVVYNSNVNLRAAPSIESKVVGTTDTGESLIETYSHIRDTLNGTIGNWIEVLHENRRAYIWSDLIANSVFKLHTDLDYNLLIKQESKNTIGVKVFLKGEQIQHQQIDISSDQKLSNAFSIGTAYNSDGKEIIVFTMSTNTYLLFQWENEQLTPFNKELPLPSLSGIGWAYIIGKNVNVRADTSLTSSIITTAQLYDKLEVLHPLFKQDTINNQIGHWSKVNYQNQEAYIWDKFIAPFSIESLKTQGLSFIGNKNQIVAVKDGKKLDSISSPSYRIDNLVPLGTLGVSGVQELVAGCLYSGSCGYPSGDVIYSWDGKNFKHFVNSIGVGDGGLSEDNEVVFPSFANGTKDTIHIIQTAGESVNIPSNDLSQTSYQYFNREYIEKSYLISEDLTLIKTPTNTEKIASFIAQEFKNYALSYFKSIDFNKDGHEDAIAFARSQNSEAKNSSILIILQGNESNEYTVHSFNKKVIIHDTNSPLTDIIVDKNGFALNIYYVGYYTQPYEPCIIKLDYKYLDDQNDFQLTSEEKLTPNGDGSWSKKVMNYKKNAVFFKNSWHTELSPEN